jgi:hypothetical protein
VLRARRDARYYRKHRRRRLVQAARRTAPADAILPRILEPLRTGQGIRVGWLGNTGKGKSYAAAWFIEQLRRGGFVHVVLTVDDKDRATVYPGTQRVTPPISARGLRARARIQPRSCTGG